MAITLGPPVLEPGSAVDLLKETRTLFGIKPIKEFNSRRQVTSEPMIFDDLPSEDAYRGVFEYDNSKRNAFIAVLVTTTGNLILTFSPGFLEEAIRPGTKKKIEKTPEVIAGFASFEYFVTHLALGQSTTQEPVRNIRKALKALVDDPPQHRLKTFLDEMNSQERIPLVLFTVANHDTPSVKENYKAITWKIQQIVHKDLRVVPIKMDLKTPQSQKLGVYTYRGKFGDQDAQYVSVLYGNKDESVAAMIPITPKREQQSSNRNQQTSNRNKQLTGWTQRVSKQYQENQECIATNDIQLYKDRPTVLQAIWFEYTASIFDSNLKTSLSYSHDQASRDKPTVFLAITNTRYWFLAVPPSSFRGHLTRDRGDNIPKIPISEKRKNWRAFARKYITDPGEEGSFAAFRKSMPDGEAFLTYVMLDMSAVSHGSTIWKYIRRFPCLEADRRVGRGKEDSRPRPRAIHAGRSTNRSC